MSKRKEILSKNKGSPLKKQKTTTPSILEEKNIMIDQEQALDIGLDILDSETEGVNFNNDQFTKNGLKIILDSLQHKNIEIFKFSFCTILNDNTLSDFTKDEYELIFEALKGKKSLKSLHLHSMNINDENIDYITSIILTCPNLETLNLGNNNLSEKGCEKLKDALLACKNIKYLNLSKNNFNSKIKATQIYELLKSNNCSLDEITLDECEFTPETFQALIGAMHYSPELTSINMQDVEMSERRAHLILELVSSNRNICNFDLVDAENILNTEIYNEIQKQLKINDNLLDQKMTDAVNLLRYNNISNTPPKGFNLSYSNQRNI